MVRTRFEQIIDLILSDVARPFISFLFFLATAIFVYGVIEYLWKSDSEEAQTKGRQHILWGIAGLFIMSAAGAIIQILCNFFEAECGF